MVFNVNAIQHDIKEDGPLPYHVPSGEMDKNVKPFSGTKPKSIWLYNPYFMTSVIDILKKLKHIFFSIFRNNSGYILMLLNLWYL